MLRPLTSALNQRSIPHLEPGVAALVQGLLDRLADPPAPDLVEHFAAQIPLQVIGNLLAVPHADRGPLRDGSLAILSALEPAPVASLLARANAAVTDSSASMRATRPPPTSSATACTRCCATVSNSTVWWPSPRCCPQR